MPNIIPCFRAVLAIAALMVSANSLAAVCEATSGDTTVALLELYTSEGCSSCPPAERWLNELARGGLVPQRLVPLALHVDYWNYLGWSDRFSQAAFSQRQRDLARRTNARSVYTPGVVLSGHEYRGWSRRDFGADIERVNRVPARANLALRLERAGETLRLDVKAALKGKPADVGLYVALYESNLRTEVRAGENRGRTLEHSFVVRRLLGPLPFDASGKARMSAPVSIDKGWKAADLGVAAFVQETDSTEVLQALALPLCRQTAPHRQ